MTENSLRRAALLHKPRWYDANDRLTTDKTKAVKRRCPECGRNTGVAGCWTWQIASIK